MKSMYGMLVMATLMVMGCGSGATTIQGKVEFSDGGAVPRGVVQITGSAGSFSGAVGAEGKYIIENVAPGTYSVAVTGVMDSESAGGEISYDADGNYIESKEPAPKSLILPDYNDPTASGLSLTIPGDSYDLKVDRAAGG